MKYGAIAIVILSILMRHWVAIVILGILAVMFMQQCPAYAGWLRCR
jgi:hypothetical protein